MVKSAVTDALKDEGFMEDMTRTLTKSAISASQASLEGAVRMGHRRKDVYWIYTEAYHKIYRYSSCYM